MYYIIVSLLAIYFLAIAIQLSAFAAAKKQAETKGEAVAGEPGLRPDHCME